MFLFFFWGGGGGAKLFGAPPKAHFRDALNLTMKEGLKVQSFSYEN